MRERTLALVRHAAASVPTATLRTALGVRKQTLLALLHRLATEGAIRRAGRDGWTAASRAVPGPTLLGGTGTR